MRRRMRVAAYTGHHALAVEERDVPVPRDDEVLLAVGYCGICGTDIMLAVAELGAGRLAGQVRVAPRPA
jgi:D-arabinose 1-dehydrogenase-like Zn-dependent alcohol dehydrogenase